MAKVQCIIRYQPAALDNVPFNHQKGQNLIFVNESLPRMVQKKEKKKHQKSGRYVDSNT